MSMSTIFVGTDFFICSCEMRDSPKTNKYDQNRNSSFHFQWKSNHS